MLVCRSQRLHWTWVQRLRFRVLLLFYFKPFSVFTVLIRGVTFFTRDFHSKNWFSFCFGLFGFLSFLKVVSNSILLCNNKGLSNRCTRSTCSNKLTIWWCGGLWWVQCFSFWNRCSDPFTYRLFQVVSFDRLLLRISFLSLSRRVDLHFEGHITHVFLYALSNIL